MGFQEFCSFRSSSWSHLKILARLQNKRLIPSSVCPPDKKTIPGIAAGTVRFKHCTVCLAIVAASARLGHYDKTQYSSPFLILLFGKY